MKDRTYHSLINGASVPVFSSVGVEWNSETRRENRLKKWDPGRSPSVCHLAVALILTTTGFFSRRMRSDTSPRREKLKSSSPHVTLPFW
jgi:hypothetical protein